MKTDELRRLARAGIEAEIVRLNGVLAELGGPSIRNTRPEPSRRGRRRKMSPADRKAVSKRMKAYWAARRKSS